jgi:hypothetical protein
MMTQGWQDFAADLDVVETLTVSCTEWSLLLKAFGVAWFHYGARWLFILKIRNTCYQLITTEELILSF